MSSSLKWEIIANWELRKIIGASYENAKTNSQHLEIPMEGKAFKLENRNDPQSAFLSDVDYNNFLTVRALDSNGLTQIGKFTVSEYDPEDTYMTKVSFDGDNTFWWSSGNNVSNAFSDDAAELFVEELKDTMQRMIFEIGMRSEKDVDLKDAITSLFQYPLFAFVRGHGVFFGSRCPKLVMDVQHHVGGMRASFNLVAPELWSIFRGGDHPYEIFGREEDGGPTLFDLATTFGIYEVDAAKKLAAEIASKNVRWTANAAGYIDTRIDWYDDYMKKPNSLARPSDVGRYALSLYRQASKALPSGSDLRKRLSDVTGRIPLNFGEADIVVDWLQTLRDVNETVLESHPEIEEKLISGSQWRLDDVGPFAVLNMRVNGLLELLPQVELTPRP